METPTLPIDAPVQKTVNADVSHFRTVVGVLVGSLLGAVLHANTCSGVEPTSIYDNAQVTQVGVDMDGGTCVLVHLNEPAPYKPHDLGPCGKAIIDVLIQNQKAAPTPTPVKPK